MGDSGLAQPPQALSYSTGHSLRPAEPPGPHLSALTSPSSSSCVGSRAACQRSAASSLRPASPSATSLAAAVGGTCCVGTTCILASSRLQAAASMGGPGRGWEDHQAARSADEVSGVRAIWPSMAV